MADLTDAGNDAALERGRITQQNEPRAAPARYDRKSGRVIVELTNGCTFAFPHHLAQRPFARILFGIHGVHLA